jgi:tetratricopeptide (TPR) repeat protein
MAIAEAALEPMIQEFGEDDAQTLLLMDELAETLMEAGKTREAVATSERALALAQRRYGNNDMATLMYQNNLAGKYYQVGRKKDLVDVVENIYLIHRDELGVEHPQSLIGMANFAVISASVGELDKAIEILAEQVELCQKYLEPGSVPLRYGTRSLTNFRILKGEYDLASESLEPWLQSMESTTGLEIPYEWPTVYASRAEIRVALGDPQGALADAHRALEFRDSLDDPDQLAFLRATAVAGRAKANSGEIEPAEQMLLEACEKGEAILDQTLAADRLHILRFHEWLVELYENAPDLSADLESWQIKRDSIQDRIDALLVKEIGQG